MVVMWNPSIRKSVSIPVVSSGYSVFGFGVCPVNNDPTILKISCNPWRVEVFTLSSGVWSLIPSSNLPREFFKLDLSTQVVIDRVIYWVASNAIVADYGQVTYMIISFDLITKEFKEVNLPGSFENQILGISISKLRDSLVLFGYNNELDALVCVRMMVHDGVITSFTKLLTIDTPYLSVYKILGFRKSGEPIMETQMLNKRNPNAALEVYEPCSQDIEDLGIYGDGGSFFMGSYKESLLLLDHSD